MFFLQVYDITNRQSFTNLKRWLQELKEYGDENIVIMIVGNKIDMRHLRAVSQEEGKMFAEEKNLFFIETSAAEDINVGMAFFKLVEEITNTVIPKILSESSSSETGVWPYMPSTQMRSKTLPGQERSLDGTSKAKRSRCCK